MAYVNPLITRLDGIAALPETTYGTDATPTSAANAIRIGSRLIPRLRLEPHYPNMRDDAASGSMTPLAPGQAVGWKAILSGIEWEIRGKGSAYTNTPVTGMIEADPLFQATGWVGVFASSPSAQYLYAPGTGSAVRPSATIYAWGEGKEYKIVGCRGVLTLSFPAGRIALARFAIEGIVAMNYVDVALPSNFNYNTQIPPPAVSQAVSIGGIWSPDFDTFTLRGGNTPEWLESGQGSQGLQGYDYGFVAPEIDISALAVAQATYDPQQDQATAGGPTSRSVALSLGSVQYNKCSISEANAYVIRARKKDMKRFVGWDVTYRSQAPTLLFN